MKVGEMIVIERPFGYDDLRGSDAHVEVLCLLHTVSWRHVRESKFVSNAYCVNRIGNNDQF